MRNEIKPLEAPAVSYINTSMAVQMHGGFTCKGERDKESRNRQKKEALVLLLVEKFKNLPQVDYAQAVRQDQSRRAISRRPSAAAVYLSCGRGYMRACACARMFPLSDPFAHCVVPLNPC